MARMGSPVPTWLSRLWALAWAGHALAALGWWAFTPGGFPASNPHFWTNQVLPPAGLAVSLLGLAAALARRPGLSWLALFSLAAWFSAGAAAVLLYPVSAVRLAPLLLAPPLALLVPGAWLWRYRSVPLLPGGAALLTGVLVGVSLVAAQRSPEPATHPLDEPAPALAASSGRRPRWVQLSPSITVVGEEARVEVRCGGLNLWVRPLLTFQRRSPDRCWTTFAPRFGQQGPPRDLTRWQRPAGLLRLRYADDAASTLQVRAGPDGAALIEAHCRLDRPLYSHRNAWCEFTAVGERPLSLAFSPCPREKISVEPWGDFMGGRLRLACLDATGTFRVLEAAWNDKGPFRELARGRLPRQAPLEMTLYEGDRPACRLGFADWPRQAGTALSPTAGCGLPVNAIEFARYRADRPGCCHVVLTLAATTVGRGRDSVGHAAGTYRNRLVIRPVAEREAR